MFRNAVHRRYDQRHLLSNSSGMTHALSTLQPPSRVLTDNDVSRRGHRGSRCAHLNMFGRARARAPSASRLFLEWKTPPPEELFRRWIHGRK